MERSVSVEDFLGGLLRLNKQAGGNGMGQRTDSEAAFQEFLKRIPSAQNLASQPTGDDKPGHHLFASGSATSLFPLGNNALGTSTSLGRDANMPRVASLEMLRTFANQQEQDARQSGTSPVPTSQAQLFQTGVPGVPHNITTSQMHPVTNGPAITQASLGTNGGPLSSIGMSMAVTGAQQPLPNSGVPLSAPGVNLLAYQQLQQLQQNPILAANLQAAAALQLGELGFKIQTSQSQPPETAEKNEQRRARRMLSNRESARRSRKRKQEQLQELEGQISELEVKNENLESQCQAAAVHVQQLMSEKQRLENENQHLLSIFSQLQKSLGKEKILLHLPAALGGSLGNSIVADGGSNGRENGGADKNGETADEEADGSPSLGKRSGNGAVNGETRQSKRNKIDAKAEH